MLRTDEAEQLVGGKPLPTDSVDRGHVVYLLRDPRTNVGRYVGMTTQWRWRRKSHVGMKSARHGSKLAAWFADMQADGVEPTFEIAAVCIGHFSEIGARRVERACLNYLARDDESGELLCNEQDNPRKRGRKYWQT